MAAIATFALKPGVWFRRVRLVIVSPDSQRTACLLSGRNSTYRPVQISGTGSIGQRLGHLRRWQSTGTVVLLSEVADRDSGSDQPGVGPRRISHPLHAPGAPRLLRRTHRSRAEGGTGRRNKT